MYMIQDIIHVNMSNTRKHSNSCNVGLTMFKDEIYTNEMKSVQRKECDKKITQDIE